MNTIEKLIDLLDLEPHPEGGYFKETYRSAGKITKDNLNPIYKGPRNYSTCIHFLLTSNSFSAFHRIIQDEIWHFYDGSSSRLHIISDKGNHSFHVIGRNYNNDETPQFIVPGGSWLAAEVINKDDYSLVGCTVSPGFSFEDFELKSRKELADIYPRHERIITKITHQ